MISRPKNFLKESIPELPEPGTPVRTEIHAIQKQGIWSLSSRPQPGSVLHYALWRYPTVGLWKRITGYQTSLQKDEYTWFYALLDTSLVEPVLLNPKKNRLSRQTLRRILQFSPGMVPAALLREFNRRISLSSSETLRIERECYSLWATSGGSLKNPHPILAEVIWSMGLHEKFGLQTWTCLEDMHIKVYSVLRKAMECYSQAQDINSKAMAARALAQRMTGIGPGGVYSR